MSQTRIPTGTTSKTVEQKHTHQGNVGLTRLLCGALLLSALSGCGDDDANAEPLEPPKLRLASVAGAGKSGWKFGDAAGCVEVGDDLNQTVVVTLKVSGDWLFRPFEACGQREQCGYAEVTVRDENGAQVSQSSAATPYVNLTFAGISLPGRFEIEARLLLQDGEQYTLEDGGTVCSDGACRVTLDVALDCDLADAGGPDAASPDSGGPDAASADAGGDDASGVDAGGVDASDLDASRFDAGALDAGADSGALDAELPDAADDSGALTDAASAPDASMPDSSALDDGSAE